MKLRNLLIAILITLALCLLVISCTNKTEPVEKDKPLSKEMSLESLKNISELQNLSVIHIIVQFDKVPSTPKDKIQLENEFGIKFHDSLPNNSFTVTVPVNRLKELSDNPNIVYITDYPSERKVMSRFQRQEFYPHEIRNGDKVTVSVGFFSDITKDESKETLAKYGATTEYIGNEIGYGPGPSNNYDITITKSEIYNLAKEDAVNYITATNIPQAVTEREVSITR